MLAVDGPEQIIGPIPDWLELGPEVFLDGRGVREVLGDWSHLNECDRPPKYVIDGVGVSRQLRTYDRSENRPYIKQTFPGKNIEELKGRHSGKVAILFNGASLASHDLFRIKVPIIGMNRTYIGNPKYNGPNPDYLCIVEWCYLDRPEVREHPGLINGSTRPDEVGYRATRHPRMAPFSFDLARDGFAGPVPCTTGHLALQAAAYLGFTDLYCLGLDMGGGHFDGSSGSLHFRDANRYHNKQAPHLRAHGINVWICGSPDSGCTAFPHASFEVVC